MKTKILQPPYAEVEWGGGGKAGQYSHSAALMYIVPYSSSLYAVFHSVNYNSVCTVYTQNFSIIKMISDVLPQDNIFRAVFSKERTLP